MAFDLPTTVGAIILIMAFSIMYKNNIFFKIGNALMMGSVLGYNASQGWNYVYQQRILRLDSTPQYIVGIVLGLLLFTSLTRKYRWIARYPSAIIIGSATGIGTAGIVITSIWRQILSVAEISMADPGTIITMVIAVMMLIATFMTVKHEGVFKPIAEAGSWAQFAFYGTGLGSYAVARYGHVVGRMIYLVNTWIGL